MRLSKEKAFESAQKNLEKRDLLLKKAKEKYDLAVDRYIKAENALKIKLEVSTTE